MSQTTKTAPAVPRRRRASEPSTPSRNFIGKAKRVLRKAYQVNSDWKSVTGKILVVMYLATIWAYHFLESPLEFFFYLTLWGWTIELTYFAYALYLDIIARLSGPTTISPVAIAIVQCLGELVFAVQVVVVSFFWMIVYPQELWRPVAREFILHGTGLGLIIIDYAYRMAGCHLRNHKYVLLFAAAYTVVHVTVVKYRKAPIYPGMAFDNIFSFVVFLLGLATVVLIHKLIYLATNWVHIKTEVKTAVGISKFLLMVPRQDSMDFLSTNEDEDDQMSDIAKFGTFQCGLNSPVALTPQLTTAMTSPSLRRRVTRFVESEILLLSPRTE